MKLVRIGIVQFLAFLDVFCCHHDCVWSNVCPDGVWGTGVIEQSDGGVHCTSNASCCDPLFLVPCHCLTNLLGVVLVYF